MNTRSWGLLLLSLLLLCAAPLATAGPLRSYERAVQKGKTEKLVAGLHHKRSYARELAARKLARMTPDDTVTHALQDCVSSERERGYVRAACAGTLERWRVKESIPAMISAMSKLDPESRYWMAEAMHILNTPEARAYIEGLRNDQDLFLSTAAREWGL